MLLELRPASACTTFAGLVCRPDSMTVAGPHVAVLSRCFYGTPAPGATPPANQARVGAWASQAARIPWAEPEPPVRLRRLLPPADPATVAEIVEALGL